MGNESTLLVPTAAALFNYLSANSYSVMNAITNPLPSTILIREELDASLTEYIGLRQAENEYPETQRKVSKPF